MADEIPYKEYIVRASPYKLAETGHWSLNIYIVRHKGYETVERSFSAANTFPTREEAVAHGFDFGRRIIDGEVEGCSVDDL